MPVEEVLGRDPDSSRAQNSGERPRRRRFSSRLWGAGRSLRGRITVRLYLLAFLPLVLLAILVGTTLLFFDEAFDSQIPETKREFLEESVAEDRAELAEFLLSEYEELFIARIDDAIDWSRSPEVADAAGLARSDVDEYEGWPDQLIEERFEPGKLLDRSGESSLFLRDQIGDRPSIGEVFFTDSNGFNVGATGETTDFVQRDEEWWQAAWSDGVFVGPLEHDESVDLQSFHVAVRIDDKQSGTPYGVLKVVVNASELHSIADKFIDDDEDDRIGIEVLSGDGIIVADSASEHDSELVGRSAELDQSSAEGLAAALDSERSRGAIVGEEAIVSYARSEPTISVPRLEVRATAPVWVAILTTPTEAALLPLSGLDDLDGVLDQSSRISFGLLLLIVLITGIAAVFVSRLIQRRIIQPITQLKDEARRVAEVQMPELVEVLLAPGGAVELPAIDPIEVEADGEIDELTTAFNMMRATAIDLAGEQARGRSRDVASVLVNLGRRNQQLVGRQLQFIDQLERSESNPDTLDSLFKLDQMATRMRRNAESLLVLAGEASQRRGTKSMSVEDVLRSASAEVEAFTRVRIVTADRATIRPEVVSDLTHLLAELIENATRFSSPDTPVDLVGVLGLDDSYTISVIDQGVGMARSKMAEGNATIAEPSFSEGAPSNVLGLFVVGRLAARHGIDARLVESATIGTTAKLTIPPACLVHEVAPIAENPHVPSRNSELESFTDQARSWQPPSVPSSIAAHASSEEELPASTRQRPMAAPQATTIDTTIDDSVGDHIPPFTARQSQSVAHSADSAPPQDGRLQVRRRPRGEPPLPGMEHREARVSPTVQALADIPRDAATAKAAEMRANLDGFTRGVESGKARQVESVVDEPAPERLQPESQSVSALPVTPIRERPQPERPESLQADRASRLRDGLVAFSRGVESVRGLDATQKPDEEDS